MNALGEKIRAFGWRPILPQATYGIGFTVPGVSDLAKLFVTLFNGNPTGRVAHPPVR